MKKYYYVYAYSYDNSGFYGENNYISTEFDWGVTEFKEIETEADILEFSRYVERLVDKDNFKVLISWQEIK